MQETPKAPRTKAELQQLQETRTELIRQIDEVTDRRGQLIQQRLNAQAAENQTVAREYEIRIEQLGGRARRLEAEKDRADDLIREALARGVGQPGPADVNVSVQPAVPSVEWVPSQPPQFLPQKAAAFVRENAVSLMLGEALFFVLGGILLWRTLARRVVRPAPNAAQLQTSVDAIALEVERISENQRYVTKLLNEKLLGEGAGPAEPIPTRDKAEVRR